MRTEYSETLSWVRDVRVNKHTPGPWRLEGPWDARLVEFDYVDSNGNRHSGNVGMIDGQRGQQNEANARLIAAAPDLLLACQMAYNLEPEHGPDILEALRAAIAKAEGR